MSNSESNHSTMSGLFLTSIYLSILCPVLADWTAIEDFAVLDTALCNEKNRIKFLSIIQSDTFSHVGNILFNRKDFIVWLMLKQLKVRRLTIAGFAEKKLDEKFITYFQTLRHVDRLETYYCSNLFRLFDGFLGTLNWIVFHDSYDFSDDDLSILSQHSVISQVTSITILECKVTTAGIKSMNTLSMPNLSYIEIYYCDELTSDWLIHIAEQYNITLKHIITDKADDDSLSKLAKSCPNLLTLNVSESEATSLGISAIATNCHCLTHLDIDTCHDIDDTLLGKIAENCPNLKVLQLCYQEALTDVGILKLAEHLKKLTTVGLIECQCITDQSVIALFQTNSHLTTLNLNSCKLLTDEAILAASKFCPRLETVDFSHSKCTESVLPRFIPENIEKFKLIQNKYCDDDACNVCGESKGDDNEQAHSDQDGDVSDGDEGEDDDQWESVDGSDDDNTNDGDDGDGDGDDGYNDGSETVAYDDDDEDDNGDEYYGDIVKGITCCHSGGGGRDKYRSFEANLLDFTLSEQCLIGMLHSCSKTLQVLYIQNGHHSVNSETINAIVSCTHLHSISLKHCKGLRAASFVTIASTFHSQLKLFECEGCADMDSESLKQILQLTPNLQHLSVRSCNLIADNDIEETTIKNCRNLKKLNVSRCKLLTNKSILSVIASYRNQLEALNISYCPRLTLRILSEISCQCECLAYLNIYGCWNMSLTTKPELIPNMVANCRSIVTIITSDKGTFSFIPY